MKRLLFVLLVVGLVYSCKGKIIIDIIREIWIELSKDSGGKTRKTKDKIYFRYADKVVYYDSLRLCEIISQIHLPDSLLPSNEEPYIIKDSNMCAFVYHNIHPKQLKYAQENFYILPKEIQELSEIRIFPTGIQKLNWSPERGRIFLDYFGYYPNFLDGEGIVVDTACAYGWGFQYHSWVIIYIMLTCAPEKKLIIASSVRDKPLYSLYRFPYFMGNMKLIMEEFLNVAYREPEFYGYYFRKNEFSAIFLDTSCSRIDSVLVSIIQGMSRQGWDLVRCFRLDDSTLLFRMKKHNFVLKGYSIQTGGYILRVKIVMDTIFHVDTSKFFDLES